MFVQYFSVFTMERIDPFKNSTWATKGLHSLQLHSSPFKVFILLLNLERVSGPFMSLGSAWHIQPLRNDIVFKP